MILPSLAFGNPYQGGISQTVLDIFNRMTDEEKIGQLFMVTFQGKDLTSTSEIYQLISTYHVGGILLQRENGNWKSGAGEAAAVLALANGLQQIEADRANAEGEGGIEFIPLFLALPGGGDGYPNSQMITDLTDVPSEMSIGASWQPELAKDTGEIIGQELSLLGINMYIGPSLDVLERPHPGTTGDLGARTFGGDPFWVGKMGQAYIQGIHEGSQQKVAVIATHFPGIGASDRIPEEEVATIRKAMEDLKLIDLAPFVYVSGTAPGLIGITDGLMVSHIRYQGLQGNIRTSTRPISLDPQALSQLMALPEFTAWRDGGGITVSGSLGAMSLRKFYESTGATFSNKNVAYYAFQAGNDILQLSDFSSTEDQSELQAMTDTIRFFQQNYQDNQEFAGKVDQAVLRILSLKNRIYPTFSPQLVQRSDAPLVNLKTRDEVPSEVCRAGVTQISPNPQSMGGTEIQPPTSADRIVVLTDSRTVVPCPSCPPELDISTTILADTILKLYGPGASGLIAPSRIQSYSFRDLQGYLQGVHLPDFEIALTNSTVIVALIRTPSSSQPESLALQNLLAQRAALIRAKRIFVFALGAPYYLDSTEISKISAYYGLYSKHPSCIEVAARVLLGDLTPSGASPVNIEGVDYDLLTSLSPDPDQVIQISVGISGAPEATPTPSSAVTQTLTVSPTPMGFSLGDQITFVAGPVLDHNSHLVPDGTVLTFAIDYPEDEENIPTLKLDTKIANGMAQVDYFLDRQGKLQVSASSEPAKNSTILQLAVGEQPGFVTAIAPTNSLEYTPTYTATPTGSAAGNGGTGGTNRAGWDTLIALLLALGVFSAAIVVFTNQPELVAFRMRILLGCLIGGLAGYDLVVIGFSGQEGLALWGGRWISVVIGMVGGILGAVLGWGSLKWKSE